MGRRVSLRVEDAGEAGVEITADGVRLLLLEDDAVAMSLADQLTIVAEARRSLPAGAEW